MKKRFPTENKVQYQPEHFPAGTEFTIELSHRGFDKSYDGKIYTAQSCIYNGIRSFVITTTSVNPHIPDINESFNSCHVKTIIKRGDGPVLVNEEARKRQLEWLKRDLSLLSYHDVHKDTQVRKKFAVLSSGHDIILRQLVTMGINTTLVSIDFKKMFDVMETQGILTKSKIEFFSFHPMLINKKRLKKFLRQNINRFKIPLDVLQEQEMKDDEEYYHREMIAQEKEWDREWELRNPTLPETTAEEEGSCFDDNEDRAPYYEYIPETDRTTYCSPDDVFVDGVLQVQGLRDSRKPAATGVTEEQMQAVENEPPCEEVQAILVKRIRKDENGNVITVSKSSDDF